MQCVILAGGLGTRMRPLTETIPKTMLPAAGRPFGEWQLEYLVAQGVTDVVYVIGYRGEAIRDYFGDGARHGVRIRYADEGRTLRGTGGALRFAFDGGLLEPAFLLVYGDSFTPVPIGDVWAAFERSGKPALMTVLCNEERWDRSNVLMEGGRIAVYDKTRRHPRSAEMRHIDYGLSALRRDVAAERHSGYRAVGPCSRAARAEPRRPARRIRSRTEVLRDRLARGPARFRRVHHGRRGVCTIAGDVTPYFRALAEKSDATPSQLMEAVRAVAETEVKSPRDHPAALRFALRADAAAHDRDPAAPGYLAEACSLNCNLIGALDAARRGLTLTPPTRPESPPPQLRTWLEGEVKEYRGRVPITHILDSR